MKRRRKDEKMKRRRKEGKNKKTKIFSLVVDSDKLTILHHALHGRLNRLKYKIEFRSNAEHKIISK